jgi:PAS domain S-box-containing protein
MSLYLDLGYFSIARLSTLILSLSISAYLFSIKRKSVSTLILAIAFLGATLFNLSMFLEHSSPYYWQPYNWQNLSRPFLLVIGASTTVMCFLLFSFYFPFFHNNDRKAFKVILILSSLINLITLGLTFYTFIILQMMHSYFDFEVVYYRILAGSLGLQFLLVIFLLIRKTVLLSAGDSRSVWLRFFKPQRRDTRATRSLSIVLLLPLVAAVAYILRYFGIFPPLVTIYFVWYVFLFFYFSSILSYLNHTEERTTFQAKLVGGALVVMFVILGIVAIAVGRFYERDYVNENLISDQTTIHFEPNLNKSYNITSAPFYFDSDMGLRAGVSYGANKSVDLKFSFPFLTGVYNQIHILSGPMIYLGEEIREKGWGGYHPQPVIAPIIMNLDPSAGGGIFLKSEMNKATITWYELPEVDRHNKNTVQLTLHEDGSFDISYFELNPDPRNRSWKIDVKTTANITGSVLGGRVSFAPRLTGIHPGGRGAVLQPIRFLKDLPYSSDSPGAIFEAYDIEYYRYIHNRMKPLAFVLLGSSVFIIFFFPITLKNNLIKPIQNLKEAMEKVRSGDINIEISPRFNDEIGFLTLIFNRMLRSIRTAESNFRTLADNAHDGIFIISESGTPIYANKRASDITGFTNSYLMQSGFSDLLRHDDFNKIIEFWKTPEEIQFSSHAESIIKTMNNGEVPVELTIFKTYWQGKNAHVAVIRDITERKRNEEQERNQLELLMKLDKLHTLEILVAEISHEINKPNELILLNASFLQRAAPDVLSILNRHNDEYDDFLIAGQEYWKFQENYPVLNEQIVEGSKRIDRIVKALKVFSPDEPGPPITKLDINHVIQTAVDLYEYYIKKSTNNFKLQLESDIPKIKGNANKLELVIINLILNACQALTNKKQKISITSSYDHKQNSVLVAVCDEGIGIPEKHLVRIREAFFTTKRKQGGTGIGLYICDKTIEDHGGNLCFESQEGKGTAVTISLPLEVS